MARNTATYISPGVFTNEVDASFLGPGVGAIGAAIIGKAAKGPAMVPVTVTNYNEYANYFGDLDPKYPMGYAARAYLNNAGVANVVRVLGPTGCTANGTSVSPGYVADKIWAITATGSSADGVLCATLEVTSSCDMEIGELGENDLFVVKISGSTDHSIFYCYETASFNSGSSFYLGRVLNTDPTKFKEKGYYVRDIYNYNLNRLIKTSTSTAMSFYTSASYGTNNFQFPFNSASTPWITSQLFGGATEYQLFRVHTLGHGEAENGRFKISIKNIRVSPVPEIDPYGTFDLEVRDFNDTDRSPSIVETFTGLSLNTKSSNYILRRIGDRQWTYDQTKDKMVSYGNYNNVSKYIRIEMTTGSFSDTSLPWGFKGLEKCNFSSGSAPHAFTDIIGDLPLVRNLYDKETSSELKSYIHWGIEFDLSGAINARLSKYPTMTSSDADFSLRYLSGSDGTAEPGTSKSGLTYISTNPSACQKSPGETTSHTVLEPTYAKFTVPLAFGFDGFDRRKANPLDNVTELAAITQIGTQALRQAIDIVGDPDFIDINLLAIPGIYSTKVVDYAIDKVETRADAFYIADFIDHTSSATTVTTAKTTVQGRGYDTNYCGLYYPGFKAYDPVNNNIVELPPSIAALGAYAYNDRVSYPWFAPAGLNRGGLSQDTIGFQVTECIDRLTATERDTLYENRINPIASFPGEGIAIWGQKTLQIKASALDRINVRRLLLKARKLIASATKYLVFEQNNVATWTRFKQMVNPILTDIQRKNGLEAFKVIMDETTNTPDVIDRNIMSGKIYLKPSRSAEFIALDFIITRSGAVFE